MQIETAYSRLTCFLKYSIRLTDFSNYKNAEK